MKKVGVAIGACLAVVVLAAVILRPKSARPGIATLPDGRQIVIQGVTFGTDHTFARGSKLLAKVQQHIPRAIGRWLPQPFVSNTRTAREYLIIWYSAYDPATDTYPQVNVDKLEVVDEHGCAFRVNEYGGTQSSGRFSVKTAYVEVFPRRQKTFTLRAKFVGYPTLELQVSNPLYPITAQWTPEPLPARRSTNDVAVTLKRLRPHKNSRYVGTEIDIHEKGKRRDEWYSPSVTFRDATGNSSDRPFCRHERAWKLEVDLYKTAKAPFPEPAIRRIGDVRSLSRTGVMRERFSFARAAATCAASKWRKQGRKRFSISNSFHRSRCTSNLWLNRRDRRTALRKRVTVQTGARAVRDQRSRCRDRARIRYRPRPVPNRGKLPCRR